jgi:hypothetical protein
MPDDWTNDGVTYTIETLGRRCHHRTTRRYEHDLQSHRFKSVDPRRSREAVWGRYIANSKNSAIAPMIGAKRRNGSAGRG